MAHIAQSTWSALKANLELATATHVWATTAAICTIGRSWIVSVGFDPSCGIFKTHDFFSTRPTKGRVLVGRIILARGTDLTR